MILGMSAKSRKEARNAKLTVRSQLAKQKEENGTTMIPVMDKAAIAAKLVDLKAKYEASTSSKWKFQCTQAEDGLSYHNGHWVGVSSVAVNDEWRRISSKHKKIANEYNRFREIHDQEYIRDKEENEVKKKFWSMLAGQSSGNKEPKKKKIVEMIQRFHQNPLDASTDLRCHHFDQYTLQELPCDCTIIYECGCITKKQCANCNISICNCDIEKTTYRKIWDARCLRERDYGDVCSYGPIKEFRTSTRAAARIARKKTVMVTKPEIRIERHFAGFLYPVAKDGSVDEAYVRCYHLITPCTQYVGCDCVREEHKDSDVSHDPVGNILSLSINMIAFKKSGGTVILTEDEIVIARRIVQEHMSQPGACDVIRNPYGFGCFLKSTDPVGSPEEQRKQKIVEKMNSLFLS